MSTRILHISDIHIGRDDDEDKNFELVIQVGYMAQTKFMLYFFIKRT